MIVRIHRRGSTTIAAVCDDELLGKVFEDEKRRLDLTGSFYHGIEASEAEARKAVKNADIVNLVGKKSVALGINAGRINTKHVIKIKNVPHAQGMRL